MSNPVEGAIEKVVPGPRWFAGGVAFLVASIIVTIVAAALIEVARRKGWLKTDPATALANILAPRTEIGTQTVPPTA